MKKQFPHEPAKINYEVYSQKVSMNLKHLLRKLGIKSAFAFPTFFETTFIGTGLHIDHQLVVDNLPLGVHHLRYNINGETFVDGVKVK
jgi:hypothetical protein